MRATLTKILNELELWRNNQSDPQTLSLLKMSPKIKINRELHRIIGLELEFWRHSQTAEGTPS